MAGPLIPLTPLTEDAATCEGGICALPDPGTPPAVAQPELTLISFPTCPFVQRAVIALHERGAPFETVYIDLADKPDWFLALSPLGKVPVLKVERPGQDPAILFESAVILGYLDETLPGRKLFSEDPLTRAYQRAWVEYASAVLGDIWKLSTATDAAGFDAARQTLRARLAPLEAEVAGPYFAGTDFSAVDVVFAPAFRQLDVMETLRPLGLLEGLPKLATWRAALAARPSVQAAVPPDFTARYLAQMRKNGAYLIGAA